MITAYVGIGSNQGDRFGHIQTAIDYVKTISQSQLIATSPLYETTAVTMGDVQPDFINAVIAVETDLSADELLHYLHAIEAKMGRPLPRAKWQQRSIDLDLLTYGNKVLEDSDIFLPHPEMSKRLFVLLPLHDIAPTWIHPKTKISIEDLIRDCHAKNTVHHAVRVLGNSILS